MGQCFLSTTKLLDLYRNYLTFKWSLPLITLQAALEKEDEGIQDVISILLFFFTLREGLMTCLLCAIVFHQTVKDASIRLFPAVVHNNSEIFLNFQEKTLGKSIFWYYSIQPGNLTGNFSVELLFRAASHISAFSQLLHIKKSIAVSMSLFLLIKMFLIVL